MPVNAVMLLKFNNNITRKQIDELRNKFIQHFHLNENDFYSEGPLILNDNDSEIKNPFHDPKGIWFNVNMSIPYFGPSYERGNAIFFINCAEWFERFCPNCEIWYGHDIDDENISKFGAIERNILMEQYNKTTGGK